MSPGLNIAALTRRTGVPSDTIRKWEQRYGVLRPERTPGGQRRYTELDVARVEWLKARLGEGYRIGEAAALLGAGTSAALSAEELQAEIVEATRRSDLVDLERHIGQALSLPSTELAFLEVLAPALVEVGDRWKTGELSVAQEHLASGAIRNALQRLLADVRGEVRGVAVLACAPGERHEIGLLMLAVLLRADGWQVAYLGADTPVASAIDLAAGLAARVVCFSAATRQLAATVKRELARLQLPEELEVIVGGRATDCHDVRETVASLRKPAA